MFGFIVEHLLFASIGGIALALFLGVGLLGGWSLVLNKWVIGALLIAVGIAGVGVAWEIVEARIEARGAQRLADANEKARADRRVAISEFVVAASQRETSLRAELTAAMGSLDLERQERERNSHVSKAADAGCVVTRGFVWDFNAAVPGSVGRAVVPPPQTVLNGPAAGVALSTVRGVVDWNFTEAAKLQRRLESCERQRYEACIEWDKKFGTDSKCQH
jgi:hypothetical protein